LLDDAGLEQPAVQRDRPEDVLALLGTGLVAVLEEVTHRVEAVARAGDHVEQHRVRDPEPGRELLGGRGDQSLECRFPPGHEALRRLLALDLLELLRVVARPRHEPVVLDLVLRGLHHHGAHGVVAGPARPARDLMELSGPQVPRPGAVVLGEPGQQHGPDRHVDADAEGVGSADDLEQSVLRELLDESAVLGQHARVMHADAVPDQAGQRLSETGAESETPDRLRDGVLFLPAAHVDTGQRLRPFERRGLGEMHHVDGRLVGGGQFLDGLADGGAGIREGQRHRPFGAADQRGRAPGPAGQVLLEERDVTECRGHQQELGVREFDQRDLPGPSAIRLGVVVELVHHDLADVGVGALPQRQVRHDLRGGADDRRACVDRGVAGHHAHVLGAEHLAEGEELLAHQRLDRCGVVGAPALGERREMSADRDHRLAGAGRCRQDDVRARDHLDQRLLLRRIQGQALFGRPP
jgi:hypothetical protein